MRNGRMTLGLAAAAGLGLGLWAARRRATRYSFRGKAVALAGASRGLGLAMARRLVQEGAHVALLARSAEELESAISDLESCGEGAAIGLVCDVTREAEVDRALREVERALGGLDVLINNAGVILCAPFEHHRIRDFEEALATHVMAPVYATRAALPLMRRRGGGRIVNVSSIGGKVGAPHMAAYSASKHGLVGLSRSLAAELRREGIRVTVACPGLIRAGSHGAARFGGQAEKEFAWFAAASGAPLLSMSAETAARRILEACRSGRAEIVFPWQWRVAALGDAVAPGFAATANAWIDRLLPESPPEPRPQWSGDEIPAEAPERLERAAAALNQR